jgi:pimeloyl-ACP methyl ester carboxylesterase
MKPLWLICLLLLVACAPTLTSTETVPIIPGAAAHRVAYGDYTTYYETLGEGEPVVLVHGIGGGSSGFQYRKNAAALADAGFKVYALDLLGFGRSSRPAIRYTQDLLTGQLTAFLETVPEAPAAVVANGLSAAYTVRVAAERPGLISKLVLVSPTGYERLSRPQNEARAAEFNRFRGFLGGVLNTFLLEPGTQRFFLLDAYAGPRSLTEEVLASYDANLRTENARWVIFSFISGNLDQSVARFWPHITQPVLMLWGDEATNTPIGDAQDFIEGASPNDAAADPRGQAPAQRGQTGGI